jgi:hypothetical protein
MGAIFCEKAVSQPGNVYAANSQHQPEISTSPFFFSLNPTHLNLLTIENYRKTLYLI